MNSKRMTSIEANQTKLTASTLFRLSGLSALLAGFCFIAIGMLHPVNVPTSVVTATWVNVHVFATALGFFGLIGLAGLYARQVEKSGWLGLAGFILFSLWLVLITGFSFVEAFILPGLATVAPAYVEGLLGMFSGISNEIDLGILPMLWNISGPMYILGQLLFGIATFRAGFFPRWAAGLLALGAVLTPLGALLPPEYESLVMIPVGLGMVFLGYTLFTERRGKTSVSLLDQRTASPEPGKAA